MRKKIMLGIIAMALLCSTTVMPAPVPQPERYYTIAGYQISEKLILALIGGVIVLMLIILALIVLRLRKKPEENKPDPDADYEDDYDDEILIPEEKVEELDE